MFPGTLPVASQNALALLGKKCGFTRFSYMAGGSALALQLNHRKSIDFDFFSENQFELKEVVKSLKNAGNYHASQETPGTIVGTFNKIKFSLFHYPYSLIRPTKNFLSVNIASIEDIAAMKLVALTDRGTKKDFIDLYFLAHKKFSITEMFKLYEEKYHVFDTNKYTLIKCLQYFLDADDDDMPEMIEKISWEKVKEFFRKEVVRLAEEYL